MQKDKEFLSKTNMKKILLLCFLIIIMFVAVFNIGTIIGIIGKFIDVIFPFILGACIAFIFNVPMRKIEAALFKKKPGFKGKRIISYLLSLIIILGIIALALFVILPELIETIKQITTQIPSVLENVQTYFSNFTARFPEIKSITKDLELDYESIGKQLVSFFTGASGVLSSTVGFVSSIISGFATFFIAFAFSIYILIRKEELARQTKKVLYALLPENAANRFLSVCKLADTTFSNFITGQCLEACILGFMFFIVLSIMGMPYTLLISVLIAITALIPIFGAFIGCVVGALLILFISTKQALIFIITFLILQQIEGNLIYPHVVGGSVGLPSIWVLVAITVGGDLMGIAGMLIFIPLCSVIYSLFREFINNKIAKKGIPSEKYEISTERVPVKDKENAPKNKEDKNG